MTSGPDERTHDGVHGLFRALGWQRWLESFRALRPPLVTIGAGERLRIVAGVALALFFTALIGHLWIDVWFYPLMLVAPLGASSVLVFATPSSPMAQPWAVLAGNSVSALVGVVCAQTFGEPLIAAPIAVGLAITAMLALRCLHPPGGAMAITAVLSHATAFNFVLFPAFTQSLLLVLVGVLYNSATGRRYPHVTPSPVGEVSDSARRFTSDDLDQVLADYNQVLDVSRDDLEALLQRAEGLAYQRRLGDIRCGDVMSRELVVVQFGSSIEEAWGLMRHHRVKALPVVDRVRRIVGIVTMADFLRHANMDQHAGLGLRLREFLRPSGLEATSKPEVVGQIMSRRVRVARQDRALVDLVPLFSEHGHHHIPIVDTENRLVGILTQTDLVRALSRSV